MACQRRGPHFPGDTIAGFTQMFTQLGITSPWLVVLASVAIVALILLPAVSVVGMLGIWGERRVSARLQSRLGPNRVGPFGLLQSLADGIKVVLKEDLTPDGADVILFKLAPYLTFAPVFAAYMALPFGPEFTFEPDLGTGVFWLLAILSVEVVGVILAGWASNNKWSVYGAMREACQMVCYEIPLGLSIVVAVMTAGTLSLVKLGHQQSGGLHTWLIFRNPFVFVSFFVYFIASLAANKRAPFDLPESESELVAGYHTEYSGFRFTLFFFAEYAGMFVVAGIQTALFLGGWNDPLGLLGKYHAELAAHPAGHLIGYLLLNTAGAAVFTTKCVLLMLVQMWVRWTLPRPRIDQVLHTCVKVLLPLACLLLLGGAVWQLLFPDRPGLPWIDYNPWSRPASTYLPSVVTQTLLAALAVTAATGLVAYIGYAFITGRADRRRLSEPDRILAGA